MSRIVYCPSPEYLSEAENLAKELKLPITVGYSLRIAGLEFDTSLVQVINTNTENVFETNSKAVANRAHSVKCTFFEDFDINNISCIYTSEDGKVIYGLPVTIEKRYIKCIARLPKSGRWHIVLKNKQTTLGEETVNVVSTRFS
jgi:hypothetical protein